MTAIGGHQSAAMGNDEWLTPPWLLARLPLFDLDPCAPVNRPWDTAKTHYTREQNGLRQQWRGFVWMNPPYGREISEWMGRMAHHGNGVALVFARTETRWFQEFVWCKADAVSFIHGRLHFYHADGSRASANSGAPSCLVAYGPRANRALMDFDEGTCVRWSNKQ